MMGNIVGQMKRFVQQHYAWLFSGIGVAILVVLWKLILPTTESARYATQDFPPAQMEILGSNERINIFKFRAENIQSIFESAQSTSAKKQFTKLHMRHIQAIESGQELLAHEIKSQIDALLSRHRDIGLDPAFYTVAEADSAPPAPTGLRVSMSAPGKLRTQTVENKPQAVSNTEVHAGAFDPNGFDPNAFDTGSLLNHLSDSKVKEIRKDTVAQKP